jgi:hypothetical protein
MARKNRCDSVTVVTKLRDRRPEDRGLIPGTGKAYSLHHRIHTDCEICPAYCTVGIGAVPWGSVGRGVKLLNSWLDKECAEIYLHPSIQLQFVVLN